MKTLLKYILTGLLAVSAFKAAADTNVLTVAVFDFDSKDEAVRDFGAKVAALVTANLSADPQIVTVERADIEKVMGEQELGLSGTVSSDTAAKIGQLTGAKVVVTGRVFKADEQTILVAKIIGTETSRVYGEMVQGGSTATLPDLSAALAKKIAADVTEKGATLTAKVESRDEWMAKLKQSIVGTKLPVVSVKIGEQHYGPHIIDPAAETEFSVLLQQCGFKLADDDSTNRPTIRITGQAFSAFGMQKGNLISCTARVEITVHDAYADNILVVDRQTSVAVDIAEQTAAKKALEKAVDELAQRILPKIAK
jgi:Curli production assembly/transport component CsgG